MGIDRVENKDAPKSKESLEVLELKVMMQERDTTEYIVNYNFDDIYKYIWRFNLHGYPGISGAF